MKLTKEERQFRILMWIWAASFALGVVAALVPPFILPTLLAIDPTGMLQANLPELKSFHANPIMLVATGATEAELTGVCIAVALNVRERADWADILLAGKMVFIVGFAMALLAGPQPPLVHQMLTGGLVIDVIQFSTVVWFRRRALASRLQPRFFSPRQFETLASLAEISVPTNLAIPPSGAVENVDRYLASFESPRRLQAHMTAIALEYIPLISMPPKVPLSRMGREERRQFVQRRFYRSRGLARDLIRGAKQLVYLGFYSDARTFNMTGFVPYPDRPPRPPRPSLPTQPTGSTP